MASQKWGASLELCFLVKPFIGEKQQKCLKMVHDGFERMVGTLSWP